MSMARGGVGGGGRRRKSRDALTSRPEIERLLDAARAPASTRELAGEHAAVDLFARARLERAAAAAEPPSRSSRTGLKAAAASVAAVVAMSGGVAFAATGHVPFAGTIEQVTRQVTDHGSDRQSETARDGSPRGETPQDGQSHISNGPKAAALQGLCIAYARIQRATHGHALEARPFTTLVEAAGGADQVDGFCAALPAKQDRSSHPTQPTHPTAPSGEPTDHASTPTHPTGPAGPTDPPSHSHPSRPTDKPSETVHPTRPTSTPSRTSKPTSHAAD